MLAAAGAISCSPDAGPGAVRASGPADGVGHPPNPLTAEGARESLWRQHVGEAPVADRSETLVDDLNEQVTSRYGGVAAFNVVHYGTSTWTAPWWVAREDVDFDDCQDRGDVPAGLYDGPEHFADVPIPATAVPSPGRDNQLTIYSPSTDQLWEFWKATLDEDGWSACWGGRIDEVSRSTGAFDGAAGASAAGVAVSGGAVTVDEARRGRIDHALSLAIPEIASGDRWSWPAQRTDGRSDDEGAILMGQRFRLDPDVDVSALDLHPVAEAVARAAQSYGFVVTDTSGAVSLSADTGEAASGSGGEDPWREVLDGTPTYAVMDGFPWDRMEALPEDWGGPRS